MAERAGEVVVVHVHAFGMTHPTWRGPDCFFYDTAGQAQEAIVKVYGPGTEHRVVERRMRVTPTAQVSGGGRG